jgi:transposase
MPKSIVLTLTDEEREYLVSLSKTRTIQAQVVDRARMLLWKERGLSNAAIANGLDINIKSVNLCLEKYFEAGVEEALFDKQRDGRPAEITADAVAWMTDIACQRPADLGYSQELWTLHNLHQHIQSHAEEAGYLRLKTITKARIQQILKQSAIKPFKIKYYCERRDPDFESKMHDVLLIYKQVELQFDDNGDIIIPEDGILTVTLSYDEKPGIQAVANTSDDLRPTAQNGAVFRDYEYKRLGTVSLLAAIDLLTGEAIPLISDTHKSSDFITFLKMLDTKYPSEHKIRIILDNHSAHTSKETRNFLATMPEGRFEFIFTPKHGSWLNMIESFFGKMTKQMLRGIRVKTKQELVDRIYQYFTEVNREPVIFRWTYKMDEVQSEIGNV